MQRDPRLQVLIVRFLLFAALCVAIPATCPAQHVVLQTGSDSDAVLQPTPADAEECNHGMDPVRLTFDVEPQLSYFGAVTSGVGGRVAESRGAGRRVLVDVAPGVTRGFAPQPGQRPAFVRERRGAKSIRENRKKRHRVKANLTGWIDACIAPYGMVFRDGALRLSHDTGYYLVTLDETLQTMLTRPDFGLSVSYRTKIFQSGPVAKGRIVQPDEIDGKPVVGSLFLKSSKFQMRFPSSAGDVPALNGTMSIDLYLTVLGEADVNLLR